MAIEGFFTYKREKNSERQGRRDSADRMGTGQLAFCRKAICGKLMESVFDRPSRIEKAVEELTGRDFAEYFWKEYRGKLHTQRGYPGYGGIGIQFCSDSVQLPSFMEDGPGIHWKEEGFVLLDRCLTWCEEAGMYAFWICMERPVDKPGRISMTLWITFPDCS